jgi:hypothetical protein
VYAPWNGPFHNGDNKETNMNSTKTLLAAASLAVAMAGGVANAAPWDQPNAPANHELDRRDVRQDVRKDVHHDVRRIVDRDRVFATLRTHHYRWLGDPVFVRGHYVVKVAGRFGHPIFVEVDPYTGAFIGEFRV